MPPPPPPATPSPHRFLPPREPRSVKPPSSLRHSTSFHAPTITPAHKTQSPAADQSHKSAPPKRFINAPSQAPRNVDRSTGPPESTWTQTPRPRRLQRVESIEEGSQETITGEESNRLDEEHIFQTTETDHHLSAEEADEDDSELLFTPVNHKRRRLSPPEPSFRVENSSILPPITPAPSYRFLPSRAPAPSSTPSNTLPAPITRPSFIIPTETSKSPPGHPLPETFSPQRRGQKFVPGGLASSVQSWIIDVAHAASHSTGASAYGARGRNDEGLRLKMRVNEMRAGGAESVCHEGVDTSRGGMLLVRGSTDPALYNASRASVLGNETGEIYAILAGQGRRAGNGGTKTGVGNVLGIRSPCWDIEVKDMKWVVGVDWTLS